MIRSRIRIWIVLLAVSTGCNRSAKQATDLKPEEFPVIEVFKRDVSIPLEYVASIEAIQNVEIRARVEGYLKKYWWMRASW